MARRNTVNDGDNNARFKFVYLEAENISSDISGALTALASAIKNAPAQVIQQQQPQIQETRKAIANGNGQTTLLLTDDEGEVVDAVVTSEPQKRPARERKSFKGEILDSIKWDGGGTSFESFMAQKNPQDTMKKYLVIVAWFKSHGEHESVNGNLIYNAYRKMGWGTVEDITKPLRNGSMSNRGYFRVDGKGGYAITNIGMDIVDKMGSEKPSKEG